MDQELKNEILKLYPEYDTITGPYYNKKDGRTRISLRSRETKTGTMRQLAKPLLEIKLGRRLVGDETVDHKDENKANDDPDNLQVLSRSENARKGALGNKFCVGYKHLEEHKRNGEKNGQALISNDEVRKIRNDFFENNISRQEIISKTKMTDRTVRNMLSGLSYKNAGGAISIPRKTGRPKKSG